MTGQDLKASADHLVQAGKSKQLTPLLSSRTLDLLVPFVLS
jgi:hypothetical protein